MILNGEKNPWHYTRTFTYSMYQINLHYTRENKQRHFFGFLLRTFVVHVKSLLWSNSIHLLPHIFYFYIFLLFYFCGTNICLCFGRTENLNFISDSSCSHIILRLHRMFQSSILKTKSKIPKQCPTQTQVRSYGHLMFLFFNIF